MTDRVLQYCDNMKNKYGGSLTLHLLPFFSMSKERKKGSCSSKNISCVVLKLKLWEMANLVILNRFSALPQVLAVFLCFFAGVSS